MPKLTGLFDSFDNLDQIPPEDIAVWLKPVPPLTQLENYVANRILYPQTISQTPYDMQIDLAILRAALRVHSQKPSQLSDSPFLNIILRKILIPREFLNFVPDLAGLVFAFIDALLLERKKTDWFEDLWTIALTGETDEVIGSVIVPQFNGNSGVMSLKLYGKNYEIKQGGVMVIPCPKEKCEMAYKLQSGKALGRAESSVVVYGGKLGLMIDGRNR